MICRRQDIRDLFEKSPLLERVSVGKVPVGSFNYLGDTIVLGTVGTAGFDLVIIDNEHTGMEREAMEKLILAAELSQIMPLVCVPELIPYLMRNCMEMNARGVLVPHIRSKAERGVAQGALRYSPYGNVGCYRPNHADGLEAKNWMKYLDHIQGLVFILMIEDPETIGHLDEILDELKPGRGMMMFRKVDCEQVCSSLNTDGAFISKADETYLKVTERYRVRNTGFTACPSAGPAGQTIADVKKVVEEGCSAVILNTDQLMLVAALGNIVGPCPAPDIEKREQKP